MRRLEAGRARRPAGRAPCHHPPPAPGRTGRRARLGDVVANRVFVLDPPVYSSAGVTTGIDLALHRVAALCGEALAAQVAQTTWSPLRRGPRDAELALPAAPRPPAPGRAPRAGRAQPGAVQLPATRRPWPTWPIPRRATSGAPVRRTRRHQPAGATRKHPPRHRPDRAAGRPQRHPGRRPGRLRLRHAAAPGLARGRIGGAAIGSGHPLSR